MACRDVHQRDDGRLRPKSNIETQPWYTKLTSRFGTANAGIESTASRGCRSSTKTMSNPNDKLKPDKARSKAGWVGGCSMAELRKRQLDDRDIAPIIKWLEAGRRPHGHEVCASSPTTRHYWNNWDSLEFKDGVLFRKFYRQNLTGCHLLFIVPHMMRKDLMHQIHGTITSGHLGKKKTRERALQRIYWLVSVTI